jgi:hypothetical protein
VRREQVHLEHGLCVRADGLLPEAVDAQLGELVADAGVECARVLELRRVGGVVVDVEVAWGGLG